MSVKVIVRQGDITQSEADLTDSAPLIEGTNTPKLQVGHAYGAGQAGIGQITYMERTGSEMAPGHRSAGRRLTTVIEDITNCDRWVFRGRVTDLDIGRGPRPGSFNAEQDVTHMDGNVELRGQAFQEVWVRPSETDYDRLVALQAYTLNGTASTSPTARGTARVVVLDSHLCKNANNVTLDAKTYPIGTEPQDVIEDCRIAAGKDYGVVIHEGPVPSASPATPVASYSGALPGLDGIVVDGADTDRALLVFIFSDDAYGTPSAGSVIWYTNSPGHTGTVETFVQIGSPVSCSSPPLTMTMTTWLLLNPSPSVGVNDGEVHVAGSPSGGLTVHYLKDVAQVSAVTDIGASSVGTGSASISTALTPVGGLMVDCVGYVDLWGSEAYASEGAGQTADAHSGEGSQSFGNMETILASSHKVGATSGADSMSWSSIPIGSTSPPAWYFTGSVQQAVAIAGSGEGTGDCDHLCLEYIVPDDLATNPSIARISDYMEDYAPLDPTAPTFFPIPDQGKYTHADHESLLSGLVYGYQTKTGTGFIFTEDAGVAASYDRWIEAVTDSEVETPAEAALRAVATLNSRKLSHVTHKLSIMVNPDQVHLVRAGMAIQIRSKTMLEDYIGDWLTRRIASVLVETFVNADTYGYKLTLMLDRPLRIVPAAASTGASVGDPSKATAIDPTTSSTDTIQNILDHLYAAISGAIPTPSMDGLFLVSDAGAAAWADILVDNGEVVTDNGYVVYEER